MAEARSQVTWAQVQLYSWGPGYTPVRNPTLWVWVGPPLLEAQDQSSWQWTRLLVAELRGTPPGRSWG